MIFQFNESHHNNTALSHDGDGFDLDRNISNSAMQYNYSHDNDGGGYMMSQPENNFLHKDNVVRYNIGQNDGRKNSYGRIDIWGRIRFAEVYNNTIYMNQAPSGTLPRCHSQPFNRIERCGERARPQQHLFHRGTRRG